MHPPPEQANTPMGALHALVVDLFSADEFRRWLRHGPDSDIVPGLPGETAAVAAVVDSALEALGRRGRIDANFFTRLTGVRGGKREAIAAVAALWAKPPGQVAHRYQADVERLERHTDAVLRRLQRFTTLTAPEGPVEIERPIASVIAEAARATSLVVTGEPGAGKSAVLHAVAQELRSVGPVVTLTVEATAISLDALRTDIGLEHPLLEVLTQMPGLRPAFLVLDALDAARGGPSESTYKQLVERVVELSGWRVVASVRTFDLRMGREWKRLFAGRPVSPTHADLDLANIRHVHVPLLTPDELAQLDTVTPSLAAAIAIAGAKVAALARNLFNLALLGDLLSDGVSPAAFAKMATRGDLLERYWSERIAHLGLPATVALAVTVKRMIAERTVDLAETDVDMSAASTLQELQRAGVLVTESTCRIGFRHHVLFDYAVARLALRPNRVEALTFLNRSQGIGLLVSASLGYWLESVKASDEPEAFWALVAALTTDPEIDPIIRVESARLAVEGVGHEERLDAAISRVQDQEAGNRLLSQLAGALLTMKRGNLPITPAPWADLLGKLSAPPREQLGSILAMLDLLIECDDLHENDRVALGKAARTLYDAMGENPDLVAWLARSVVPLVARTYGTDPAASRDRLQRIFEPERFRAFGHLETPWLATGIGEIAEHDPNFAVHVFYRGFLGGDFSADQKTTLSNSWILGMTSNARQDFEMTRHALGQAFPRLLAERPLVALRALGATVKAVCEKERRPGDGYEPITIPYGSGEATFALDHSAIWAWQIAEVGNHDDAARIFRAFLDWASGPAEPNVLCRAPDLILQEHSSALAWRALFQTGASRPADLGVLLWHSASAEPVLQCDDTRQSAIDLIAATHPLVSADDRRTLEEALFRFDFSASFQPERRRMQLLAMIFASIGEAKLETDAARTLLAKARAEALDLANRKPFEIGRMRSAGGAERRWAERMGIDASGTSIAPLIETVNGQKAACKAAEASASAEDCATVWRTTEALEKALAEAGDIDPLVESEVGDALAAGLSLSLRSGTISMDGRSAAISRLLELSRHPDPASNTEIEAQFAHCLSWGSPAVRIRAAQGLAEVISPETWPAISPRVEELMLRDPHPAVRFKMMSALPSVAKIDTEALWHLIERCTETETNPGVIVNFGAALIHLQQEHAERLEPFVLRLAERFENAGPGLSDPLTFLCVESAIQHGLQASATQIRRWMADYVKEERRLVRMLQNLRSDMIASLRSDDSGAQRAGSRCNLIIWALIDSIEPSLRSWTNRGGDPEPAEIAALKLFRTIGEQLYFAVGHGEGLPRWLDSVADKRAFLEEKAPLISRLSTLGDPGTVHHMLELIGKLVEGDPRRCFDLFSEAMLRTTGVARYERESLGAKKFVELVSRYLGDHRDLFDDPVRRGKLIDCIAVFVDAGWPEARHLFQNLPSLMQ